MSGLEHPNHACSLGLPSYRVWCKVRPARGLQAAIRPAENVHECLQLSEWGVPGRSKAGSGRTCRSSRTRRRPSPASPVQPVCCIQDCRPVRVGMGLTFHALSTQQGQLCLYLLVCCKFVVAVIFRRAEREGRCWCWCNRLGRPPATCWHGIGCCCSSWAINCCCGYRCWVALCHICCRQCCCWCSNNCSWCWRSENRGAAGGANLLLPKP